MNNPEYSHLLEDNKELYMSSSWYASHWSYKFFQSFFSNMFDDNKKYFVSDLPYQLPIREGLLKRSKVESDMSESTFDEIKFSMEYGGFWYGDTDGSFFTFNNISRQRKVKLPLYSPNLKLSDTKIKIKIPDLELNERRILSLDVALMASKKHKNDASSIFINRAIPTNKNDYIGNIVFADACEGKTTDELALYVRRLFDYYKCTDLIIDCQGLGMGVYDALVKDIFDAETGKLYPALSCCNNKEMAERCKVENAPKVIWAIKASASFNTEICTLLRSGFSNEKINLLISDEDAEDVLNENYKYNKLTPSDKTQLLLPYMQTTFLVYELINLNYEVNGTNIKIREKTGMRKDRYSSLAYNYWVQCELERENLRKPQKNFSLEDYAKGFKRLNKRPTIY